ncbi:hypothetical protein RJ639_038846 [Escallonia herrerae]|uniref:ENTH domain-containing protein n=1 Tax=Escallonia herrerae TaxID=1293975 RepID=A0AA88WMS6_9ASTE|nr:hypothetical protein RJ639_038846 [Escallonia herrerae]
MKLWKRASGVLKDQNSIWIASLSRRTTLRNPDIEAAVIKATSHNESYVDYRNAQRVFAWVRMSPNYLKPLVWVITIRMEKTRSWVVALKGLMLMHGIFCCKVPVVQKIGRLPFDFSNFKDGHSNPSKTWGYNAFIRAYYAFLDKKSTFVYLYAQECKGRWKEEEAPLMQDLVWLQKLQGLLDMLLQLKPQTGLMIGILVLEAMDCIVIEIFDVYSQICNRVAIVLMQIYSVGKVEAAMALRVLQKTTIQGEELAFYFQFCRDIGVINASECPKVEQIPDEAIRELEDIINGVYEESNTHDSTFQENKAIVVRESNHTTDQERKDSTANLQTIITNRWEVFEDDQRKVKGVNYSAMIKAKEEEPFVALVTTLPHKVQGKNEDLPDLISF